ncbi:MAG: fused MFS/spermidine synthase [Gammaproteobacteria bacterium]
MKKLLLLIVCCLPLAVAAEVIYEKKSLYRNISVIDQGGELCMRFTLRRTRFSSMQSCMYKKDHDLLVFDYAKLTFAGLLMNPNPKRVLIAGLGGGSLARVFREAFPDAIVDAVEIDSAVIDVADRFFDFRAGGNINIIEQDARVFVKRQSLHGKQYDYIVLDAFNGEYIPEHLMTREFLEECRSLLTADGVLVANTFSLSRLYDAESVTYEQAFGWLVNVKQETGNRIILTSRAAMPGHKELRQAAASFPVDLSRFGLDLKWVARQIRLYPDWNRNARPLTDQYNPANLLNTPQ